MRRATPTPGKDYWTSGNVSSEYPDFWSAEPDELEEGRKSRLRSLAPRRVEVPTVLAPGGSKILDGNHPYMDAKEFERQFGFPGTAVAAVEFNGERFLVVNARDDRNQVTPYPGSGLQSYYGIKPLDHRVPHDLEERMGRFVATSETGFFVLHEEFWGQQSGRWGGLMPLSRGLGQGYLPHTASVATYPKSPLGNAHRDDARSYFGALQDGLPGGFGVQADYDPKSRRYQLSVHAHEYAYGMTPNEAGVTVIEAQREVPVVSMLGGLASRFLGR